MNINNSLQQLSWSKVNLFLQCPCCFYKEQVLKMKRPSIDPDCFSLNNAVDLLLKNEFDKYRREQKAHPIMIKNKIEAVPLVHESFPAWRNYKSGGIRFRDDANGIELYGIVDDVWINPQQEFIIVDYKATAKQGSKALNLSNSWNSSNKRQMSFYAFIFKKCGYTIHHTGYFLYSIADNNKPALNEKLEFETRVVSYELDDTWVEATLQDIRYCLDQRMVPVSAATCEVCRFGINVKVN